MNETNIHTLEISLATVTRKQTIAPTKKHSIKQFTSDQKKKHEFDREEKIEPAEQLRDRGDRSTAAGW